MHLFKAKMRTIPEGVQDDGRIFTECGCQRQKLVEGIP